MHAAQNAVYADPHWFQKLNSNPALPCRWNPSVSPNGASIFILDMLYPFTTHWSVRTHRIFFGYDQAVEQALKDETIFFLMRLDASISTVAQDPITYNSCGWSSRKNVEPQQTMLQITNKKFVESMHWILECWELPELYLTGHAGGFPRGKS